MAEGPYDPDTENETPREDPGIDHDDDDDDDDDEVYRTPLSSPIKPPPPEDIEMRQFPREKKSNWQLSTKEKAWIAVKKRFPQANEDALEADYERVPGAKKVRLSIKMKGSTVAFFLFEKDFLGRWKENQYLPPPIKSLLGKSLEEQMKELKLTKIKKLVELAEKQAQKKNLEQKSEAVHKLNREINFLTQEIQDVEEEERTLKDSYGKIDAKVIQKLKDEKKALEGEKKTKQKQITQQNENIKKYNKIQTEIEQLTYETREIDQNLSSLRTQEANLTPLDQLKQEAEELKRTIAEDRQLADDENTPTAERNEANARLLENEADLRMINVEIEAREIQKPLLERVKDVFKKYGWTLQAVFVAVAVAVSSILGAIALAAKKGTKIISQNAKVFSQKLTNAKQVPGFIGPIVSFIFKAASQVFAFLSEHTWLLILVVVAFFMEKLLKKSRK